MPNNKASQSAIAYIKIVVFLIIGAFSLLFGIVGFSIEFSEEPTAIGIVIALIMSFIGIALIYSAVTTKSANVRYKQYIAMIVNQNIQNIDNIASTIKKPYQTVIKDLQKMISKGLLDDAFIDQNSRQIIMKQNGQPPQAQPPKTTEQPQGEQATPQTHVQTKSVRCPGCGANNVVTIGVTSPCEYCGTPINA